MMRRLFWLAMGVTIGSLVVRKMSSLAEKLTPRGMAGGLGASLGNLADSLGSFGADVRAAMAEREAELRENVGLDGTVGRVANRKPEERSERGGEQ